MAFEKEFQSFQRQQELQTTNADPLMQGFPGNPMQSAQEQQAQGPSFMNLMRQQKQLGPQEQMNAQFQKLGIVPSSISTNTMGRKQLEQKLAEIYGTDFAKNPTALEVLKSFDAFMGTDEGKLNDVKLKNKTENILEALRGYGS